MNNLVKNKWIYGIIWIAVAAMIVWIVAGTAGSKKEPDINVNQQARAEEHSENIEPATETVEQTGYYFIREEEGMINVYWVDQDGEHLHLETSIEFSLLNAEDQRLIEEGVRLDNDEELAGFLENYDS